jgi:RecA/RadA recombinase
MGIDLLDTIAKMREGINKDLGKKVALDLSTEDLLQVDQWINMDRWFTFITGKGAGIPCGHITQVIGEPDSGKTSLIISMMIACQKQGGVVFMIDSEHKFPVDRFIRFGGNVGQLLPLVADTLEEAWTNFDAVIEQTKVLRKKEPNLPILLVWDSIAASVPDAIKESEVEDSHVAVQAKINNAQVIKFRQEVRRNNIAAVLVNHSYFEMATYGVPKEIIKGGKELTFHSTLIFKCQKMGWLDREKEGRKQIIGVKVKISPFKCHLSDLKGVSEVAMLGDTICFLDDAEKIKATRDRIDEIFSGIKVDTVEEKDAADKARKKK